MENKTDIKTFAESRHVQIVADHALDFLAKKHKTTPEVIVFNLKHGNEGLMDQFKTLVKAGLEFIKEQR